MQFESSFYAYIAVGLAVVGLFFLYPIYSRMKVHRGGGESGESSTESKRWIVFVLRVLVIAALLLVIFNPMNSQEVESEEMVEVAVLVDGSRSMEIVDGNGRRRWDDLLTDLPELRSEIGKDHEVKIYSFAEVLEEGETDAGVPSGKKSHLIGALKSLMTSGREKPLGAIIVLSDGQVTDGSSLAEVASDLQTLNVPVYGVPYGEAVEQFDLALLSAKAEQPIPFERKVSLVLELRNHLKASEQGEIFTLGDDGLFETTDEKQRYQSRLTVKQGERIVFDKVVGIRDGEQTVQVDFVAPQLGFQDYEVEFEAMNGERLTWNNSLMTGVEVVDEKIRVLYIEGTERDFETLPYELEKDPAMEVTTMIVQQQGERSPDNYKGLPSVRGRRGQVVYNVTHPERGMPKDRESILEYDVIINSDIMKEVFTDIQFNAMVELVEKEGGGFVMVGGDTAFGAGGYDETPVDSILPVEIKDSDDVSYGGFTTLVTEGGMDHPVLRLEDDPAKNRTAIRSMPQFMGLNRVDRPKPGAVLLAQNVSEANRNGPLVLWAVQQIGRGRSMAFTSDTTRGWGIYFQDRWGVPGDPRKHYRTFWNNTVRWLAADRIARKAAKSDIAMPSVGLAGSSVSISLPESQVDGASLLVTGPDGEVVEIHGDGEDFDYQPTKSGRHIITSKVKTEKGFVYRKHLLHVREDLKELDSTKARPEVLEELGRLTGGGVVRRDRISDLRDSLKGLKSRIVEYRNESLWDRWWVLLLILGLVGLEWGLRRKWGMSL